MKLIRVDFDRVTDDGLVRSFTDRANVPLFMHDMVLAHDGINSAMAQVVEINGIYVRLAIDPARSELDLVPA